jgi:hypothetical protein
MLLLQNETIPQNNPNKFLGKSDVNEHWLFSDSHGRIAVVTGESPGKFREPLMIMISPVASRSR